MLFSPSSDEDAGGNKTSSSELNLSPISCSLIIRKKTHLPHVVVVLILSHGGIEHECLDTVVEFVLIEVSKGFAEDIMYPESVICSISVFVVVNDPKSISKSLRIHHWVQSISRGVENGETRSIRTSILLLSKVLYKNKR